MATCDLCGDYSATDDPPITWLSSIEQGRRKTFCPDCSRQHLRSIEAKLDSEWW